MAESKFEELCSILDTLLGPNGCPWDKKQTLETLKVHLLEETSELIDAISTKDSAGIREELGDLFLNAALLAKVATKEGHCTLDETLTAINEKLIRRHPHIFGQGPTLETAEEVLSQWQEIKKQEKGEPESVLDSLPKSLPALERARKAIKKMKKVGYTPQYSDETLGDKLFHLAASEEAHAELELRKVCQEQEEAFRKWEQTIKKPSP